MIKLKRILVPVDHTPFEEICSFETENYIGVFVDIFPVKYTCGYVIIPRSSRGFSLGFIDNVDTLEQLDESVFIGVGEHIISVSTSRRIEIKINEDY